MTLTIPEKQYEAIQKLNALSESDAEKLYQLLSAAPPSFSINGLISNIDPHDVGLEQEGLSTIVSAVVSLYYLWSVSYDDLAREEFAEEVASAAQRINDADWENLSRNLKLLLKLNKSVGVTAKAFDLMTEYDRIFRDVRVVTDSRPIFAEDSEENPVAVLATHVLKIDFSRGEQFDAFYIAMDSNDIKRLQDVLKRALKKEKNLKEFFTSGRRTLSYLDASALLEEEDDE